jgi:hypothetical protein
LLVIAAIGLVAAPASAGTTTMLGTGTAGSATFHLELHLPGTGGTPLDISQDFAVTSGTVTAVPAVTRSATASLASGTGLIQTVLGQGVHTAQASDQKTTDDASLAPTSDLGGLGSLGLMQAKATVDDTPGAHGTASVASLRLGLTGPLAPAAAALSTALNQALSTATDQLTSNGNQLAAQLSGDFDQLLAQLPDSPLTSYFQQGKQLLTDLPATLAAVTQQVQAATAKLGEPGGLLDVGLIQSGTDVTRTDTVTATSTAQVGDVSALGGLGRLGLIRSTATAKADGRPGGASATVDPKQQILDLQVGNLADIDASVAGLKTDLSKILGANVSGPMATVVDQLNAGFQTLLSSLNAALGNLGVSVADLGTNTSASPDGTHASATSKGVGIQVTLPAAAAAALNHGDKPLLRLTAVPVSATVAAEQEPASTPVAAGGAAKTGTNARPAPRLAYTGTDLTLERTLAAVMAACGAGLLLVRAARSKGPR